VFRLLTSPKEAHSPVRKHDRNTGLLRARSGITEIATEPARILGPTHGLAHRGSVIWNFNRSSDA
jgi:hypothetical protein